MRAIVFGGSGFLGSHVADAITKEGHDVTVFDLNKSSYIREGQTMVIGDILDEDAVQAAIKGHDIVYNFAGIADIYEASEDPIQTIKTNVLGNTIILKASRLNNIKRYIFASSIYVYSKAGSFYRSSKQACECIIEDFNEQYGLPFTILRYGSLYGPRANKQNWVYRILKQAITEKKITRYGDGEEIREYIHVEDAAQCSLKILSDEFENQAVIITGSQPMKVRNVMTMIKEMLDNKIELEFLPSTSNLHYEITPYTFNPKTARRIISNSYIDMGQGLLQCLEDIHKKHYPSNG